MPETAEALARAPAAAAQPPSANRVAAYGARQRLIEQHADELQLDRFTSADRRRQRTDVRAKARREHQGLDDQRADGQREITERGVAQRPAERRQIDGSEHAAQQCNGDDDPKTEQGPPHGEAPR